jgi:hypothetical protein
MTTDPNINFLIQTASMIGCVIFWFTAVYLMAELGTMAAKIGYYFKVKTAKLKDQK